MIEEKNCSGLCSAQQKVFIDVSKRFGVTSDGINKAIELSRQIFHSNPEAEIILYIKQGEYFINSTINLSDIKPGDKNISE